MPDDDDFPGVPRKSFDQPADCSAKGNLYRGLATGKARIPLTGQGPTPKEIADLSKAAEDAAKKAAEECVALALKNKCPGKCPKRRGTGEDGKPDPNYRDPEVG